MSARDPGSAADAGPPSEEGTYIHGGGGVDIDGRLVGRVLVGACVLALATLAIVLAVQTTNQNARINRLRHHGVPVAITVSGCVGLASGTGITAYGYTCRGTFTLAGHRYDEVIGGIRSLQPVGQTLRGVTLPGDPSVLSTVASVKAAHASWRSFDTPALLVVALVVIVAFAYWRHRRARRRARDGRGASFADRPAIP